MYAVNFVGYFTAFSLQPVFLLCFFFFSFFFAFFFFLSHSVFLLSTLHTVLMRYKEKSVDRGFMECISSLKQNDCVGIIVYLLLVFPR